MGTVIPLLNSVPAHWAMFTWKTFFIISFNWWIHYYNIYYQWNKISQLFHQFCFFFFFTIFGLDSSKGLLLLEASSSTNYRIIDTYLSSSFNWLPWNWFFIIFFLQNFYFFVSPNLAKFSSANKVFSSYFLLNFSSI